MQIITNHRRGDAFKRTVYLKDKNGEPLPLQATDLCAQLYRPDKTMLVALTIVDGVAPGYYIVSTGEDTSSWPLEILKTNIFDKSDKSSSGDFFVRVTEQTSRDISGVL